MFEIIRFDKLLAQKVLNFLMYLETACLLFSHRVKARVCMLYTDSFYKYYFPFAYFRKHTTWSPINTMIYVKCELLFLCFVPIYLQYFQAGQHWKQHLTSTSTGNEEHTHTYAHTRHCFLLQVCRYSTGRGKRRRLQLLTFPALTLLAPHSAVISKHSFIQQLGDIRVEPAVMVGSIAFLPQKCLNF